LFNAVRAALFAAALLPALRLVYLTLADAGSGLGANPAEFVIRSLGTWTLVMLCVTLAVTPLRRLTGWIWLVRLRRMAGLFCFFYACLHVLTYLWLDQWFDWAAIWNDVVKLPYVMAGVAAYTLMVPLAMTSTSAMVKRLGSAAWQRLHALVYLIAVLAILHYALHKAGKNDFAEVGIYAAVVTLLLAARALHWWSRRRLAAG
jgi:sulfoxide reductase heme-binding subunit YedZ